MRRWGEVRGGAVRCEEVRWGVRRGRETNAWDWDHEQMVRETADVREREFVENYYLDVLGRFCLLFASAIKTNWS